MILSSQPQIDEVVFTDFWVKINPFASKENIRWAGLASWGGNPEHFLQIDWKDIEEIAVTERLPVQCGADDKPVSSPVYFSFKVAEDGGPLTGVIICKSPRVKAPKNDMLLYWPLDRRFSSLKTGDVVNLTMHNRSN